MPYYRYGVMWETFFHQLGCDVVIGGDTNRQIMAEGIRCSVGECCLPAKVYLGQVHALLGCCDRILVPRFECFEKAEEFCVRFWGLPDLVSGTFPQAPVLTYNLRGDKPCNELLGFLRLGREIGKGRAETLRAYWLAQKAQGVADNGLMEAQRRVLRKNIPKVLLAAQPYMIHDSYLGGPLIRAIREQGFTPVFADRCDRVACRRRSRELTTDLYWMMNKEVIGAIPLSREQVDGVILLTAFPCGTDSLANELVLRRLRGIPVTHIILDEQQGEAGLQTRIECFLDILKKRGRFHAS